MLGTNHQAVSAKIFHSIDEFVQHGEGHGSVSRDVLVSSHQLSNAVKGFRVDGFITLDQIAAECASQTFNFRADLNCQLAVGVIHGGSQEFINVHIAGHNTQFSGMLGEGRRAFRDNFVHVDETGFGQSRFAVIQVRFAVHFEERQDCEQVITVDNRLDYALLQFVITQLFSFFTQ